MSPTPSIGRCAVVVAAVLAMCVPGATHAAETVRVDFAKPAGRIRAIHGVNNGPVTRGNNADLEPWWKKAGFPTARLHDAHWPSPDVVDVSTIFPLPHRDPDDPRNYLFAKTDDYLAGILRCNAKVIYRLGQSIERHGIRFHTDPPANLDAYAKVCVNIVRHYNDGWAEGFHHGIEYWEIWNEPDIGPCWKGTQEQFFELYEQVATAIEKHDPKLKVGGPALTGDAFTEKGWGRPFLDRCRAPGNPGRWAFMGGGCPGRGTARRWRPWLGADPAGRGALPERLRQPRVSGYGKGASSSAAVKVCRAPAGRRRASLSNRRLAWLAAVRSGTRRMSTPATCPGRRRATEA